MEDISFLEIDGLMHQIYLTYRIDKFDTREIHVLLRELIDNLWIVYSSRPDEFMTWGTHKANDKVT